MCYAVGMEKNKRQVVRVAGVMLWVVAMASAISCGVPITEMESSQPAKVDDKVDDKVELTGPERLCMPAGEGQQWCYQSPRFGYKFGSVHGTAGVVTWFAQAGNLWGSTTGGLPLRLVYKNDKARIASVYAVSAEEAWAVGTEDGSGGTVPLVLRWDGKSWGNASGCEAVESGGIRCGVDVADWIGVDARPMGVYAAGGVPWVVGYTELDGKGAIWSVRAGLLTKEVLNLLDNTRLTSVWGSDASNVWVVGYDGTLLKWNGSAWAKQYSGTTARLNSVWGRDVSNVWAVGSSGTILKWDGSAWAAQYSGTMNTLTSVWGSDVSNVWAVGDYGTILKWDGSAWVAQASGTTSYLYSVWGSDASNVWAVGSTILKLNGSAWAKQYSVKDTYLTSVWGSDASNVWAVGDDGTILKWNGSAWAAQGSGTTERLNSVWGRDASNVWAVGGGGTILKLEKQP